jgi:hypothetical protein
VFLLQNTGNRTINEMEERLRELEQVKREILHEMRHPPCVVDPAPAGEIVQQAPERLTGLSAGRSTRKGAPLHHVEPLPPLEAVPLLGQGAGLALDREARRQLPPRIAVPHVPDAAGLEEEAVELRDDVEGVREDG